MDASWLKKGTEEKPNVFQPPQQRSRVVVDLVVVVASIQQTGRSRSRGRDEVDVVVFAGSM